MWRTRDWIVNPEPIAMHGRDYRSRLVSAGDAFRQPKMFTSQVDRPTRECDLYLTLFITCSGGV
jgi:hypothetical protein